MQTINITYPHTYSNNELSETVAAIGFFDGIHKGHQAVINKAVQLAEKENKSSAVISFHPHPSVVLNKSIESVEYITTINEKATLLEELGVDYFYIITFNKELSLLSPETFIDHFIIGLNVQHLVAGFDFSFGHKGAGNMKNIHSFTKEEIAVTEVDKVIYQDEKISSTNIRQALGAGAVHVVNEYLGRAYQTTGIVVEGDKRGRLLGFPTANLQIDDQKLLPKQGVYAVKVMVGDCVFEGMANLGVKPTFKTDEPKPSVEVYIFDFNKDIYGEDLTVWWHQFIRDEKKFNGIEEIKAQLQHDEKEIRSYFSK